MGDGIQRVLQGAKSLLDGITGIGGVPSFRIVRTGNCEEQEAPFLRNLEDIHADFYEEAPELRRSAVLEYALRLAKYPEEMAFADFDTYAELAFDPDMRVEEAIINGFKGLGEVLNSSSADLVAGKLHHYLDQPELDDSVLQALYVAELVGPHLSERESDRVEFLSRKWLLNQSPRARRFAADVYAALPPKNSPTRERGFNLLSALVADPALSVKNSAMRASLSLSGKNIPPKAARNLVGASRFLLNANGDIFSQMGAAMLYSRGFAALDPEERSAEIRLVGHEFLGSVWEYKRLIGLQAATYMTDSVTESESVQLVSPTLPLLGDWKDVVRFSTADVLSRLRPHLPGDSDATVVSALEKVKAKEKNPIVAQQMAAALLPSGGEESENKNEAMMKLMTWVMISGLSLTRLDMEDDDPVVSEGALENYQDLVGGAPSDLREGEETALYELARYPDPLTRDLACKALQEFPADQVVDSWPEGFDFFVGAAGVETVCQ